MTKIEIICKHYINCPSNILDEINQIDKLMFVWDIDGNDAMTINKFLLIRSEVIKCANTVNAMKN